MKYIRFNRVIFEREREKNVNFQESFRRKGKNYRSSTFSKIRLEISLLKSSNFSLSLLIHSLTLGQRGCGGTPLITQNSFSFEREIHFQSTTFLFQLILEACLRQSWRLLLTRDTGIFHFLWNIIPVLTCDAVR